MPGSRLAPGTKRTSFEWPRETQTEQVQPTLRSNIQFSSRVSEMVGGISHTGNEVEAEFRRITGASKSPKASIGDAIFEGYAIEVKKASTNTLNQVRAVKFIPLVAFDTRDKKWYVVPAPDVVRLVVSKSRGQHTENPFESATISVAQLRNFVSSESTLRSDLLAAIKAGNANPTLKKAMDDILEDSKDLAKEARKRILALLDLEFD